MRPPEHSDEDYARDLAAVTRMLRRVLSDTKLSKTDKEELVKHYRAVIAKLGTLKRRAA